MFGLAIICFRFAFVISGAVLLTSSIRSMEQKVNIRTAGQSFFARIHFNTYVAVTLFCWTIDLAFRALMSRRLTPGSAPVITAMALVQAIRTIS